MAAQGHARLLIQRHDACLAACMLFCGRATGTAETGTMHVCGLRGAPGGAEGLCSKTWNSLRQFPRCVELCSFRVEMCTTVHQNLPDFITSRKMSLNGGFERCSQADGAPPKTNLKQLQAGATRWSPRAVPALGAPSPPVSGSCLGVAAGQPLRGVVHHDAHALPTPPVCTRHMTCVPLSSIPSGIA